MERTAMRQSEDDREDETRLETAASSASMSAPCSIYLKQNEMTLRLSSTSAFGPGSSPPPRH